MSLAFDLSAVICCLYFRGPFQLSCDGYIHWNYFCAISQKMCGNSEELTIAVHRRAMQNTCFGFPRVPRKRAISLFLSLQILLLMYLWTDYQLPREPPLQVSSLPDKEGVDFVKRMFNHSWYNYNQTAWGSDYSNPVSIICSSFYNC